MQNNPKNQYLNMRYIKYLKQFEEELTEDQSKALFDTEEKRNLIKEFAIGYARIKYDELAGEVKDLLARKNVVAGINRFSS